MKRSSKVRLDDAIGAVDEAMSRIDRIKHDEPDNKIVEEFAARARNHLKLASSALCELYAIE